MQKTIYKYHSRIGVFTGTEEECWQWIVNQAHAMNTKKEKLFCISQEKNNTICDMGSAVYYIENLNIKDIIKVSDISNRYIVVCAVDGTILEVGAWSIQKWYGIIKKVVDTKNY